jgi:hypothetical protein
MVSSLKGRDLQFLAMLRSTDSVLMMSEDLGTELQTGHDADIHSVSGSASAT